MEIRNIAIIAHVDHGKTTLTDAILKQTGAVPEGFSMDSNTLEKERGITIYSKNASVNYRGTKINIVDTPGHQDFGSEVERVLRSVDTVLLVVDAQEGPMPQTRFVLKKSLELGLKPIVIINKIDKPASRIKEVEDEVLELFMELGATDEQSNFTTIFAVGREGFAKRRLEDETEKKDLTPLLDTIIEEVSPQNKNIDAPARCQPFNLAYDNFLGRMAICRIHDGIFKSGQDVYVKKPDGSVRKGRITKLFTFEGLSRKEAGEAGSGDVVMIAGIPDIFIGETICGKEEAEALPAIKVDEPTISLYFLINDSPFAGKDGKFVTSRQIRERLEKELEINVGLKVDFSENDRFKVSGRGELHIAILLENMRREGFEIQVSQPEVITEDRNGEIYEPYEEVVVDVPKEFSGGIIGKLTERRGILTNMKAGNGGMERITFEIPTRGILGFRGRFVIDTKGLGILSSRFVEFRKYSGEIKKQSSGAMIAMTSGKCLAFALDNLQQRGLLYIGPGDEVYEGQVIGDSSKGDDLYVNPTKGKQLTNMRASGSDEGIFLAPAWKLSIERAMEIMQGDEYIEITPKAVRLRKQYLTQQERSKNSKNKK